MQTGSTWVGQIGLGVPTRKTGKDYVRYTKDNEYKVTPIGRMINVRIERYAEMEEYEDLRDALKSHYSNDSRVHDVFINELGTVMIDCRN